MTKKLGILTSLLLIVSHFSKATDFEDEGYERIVNGTVTAAHERPYQALVLMTNTNDKGEEEVANLCGGALVAKNYVLTAAHCIIKNVNMTIHVGINRWCDRKGGKFNYQLNSKHHQGRSAKNITLHPNFKNELYDLALIELDRPVTLNKYAKLITLPTSAPPPANTNLTISGWGTNMKKNPMVCKLQEASVPRLSDQTCKTLYASKFRGSKKLQLGVHFCAGHLEGGPDACWGDSGGPLVKDSKNGPVIHGVLLGGEGCGQPNKPGIYTSVFYASQWLAFVINGTTVNPFGG